MDLTLYVLNQFSREALVAVANRLALEKEFRVFDELARIPVFGFFVWLAQVAESEVGAPFTNEGFEPSILRKQCRKSPYIVLEPLVFVNVHCSL